LNRFRKSGAQQGRVDTINWRQELARLHAGSFAWALHCCRRRADEAEEVLQAAYMRVLEGRAQFDGRSSAKTWLYGVIRRTASEYARRRWLRSRLFERWQSLEPERSPVSDPAELLQGSESNARLRRAVEQLSRRQQEMLHLVFYQDLTIEESAQLLGISLGSARTHFERGKQRLRERFPMDGAS
jgi:RNA polymerase sigma factor (sigma-70 family)